MPAVSESVTAIKNTCLRLIYHLHVVCHLLWIYASKFIVGFLLHRRVWPYIQQTLAAKPLVVSKKIVFIGDDNVVGVGDWVTMGFCPGAHRHVGRYLNGKIRHAARSDVCSATVAILWTVLAVGKSGARSHDWVPAHRSSTSTSASLSSPPSASYFEEVFAEGKIGHDADIVCISVGYLDKCEPEETLSNVKRICDELATSMGKCVFVATLPVTPVALLAPTRAITLRRTSELINQHIDKTNKEYAATSSSGSKGFVARGADIGRGVSREQCFRFGGRFLSGQGYTQIGNMWIEMLRDTCSALELEALKKTKHEIMR